MIGAVDTTFPSTRPIDKTPSRRNWGKINPLKTFLMQNYVRQKLHISTVLYIQEPFHFILLFIAVFS